MNIKDIFHGLTPDRGSSAKIKLNTSILRSSLNVLDKDIQIDGIRVVKIHMLLNLTMHKEATRRAVPFNGTPKVLVELASSEMRVYDFKANISKKEIEAIFYSFSILNGEIENAFNEYGTRAVIWDKLSAEKSPTNHEYNGTVKQTYTKLHPELATQIVKTIQANQIQLQKAKEKGVLLISVGCGNGEDVVVCFKELLRHRILSKCYGIEFNSASIDEAKKTCPKTFTFIEKNIADLDTIEEIKNPEDRLVVVLSSGSLTREVMQGAYSVAKALQVLKKVFSADIICIGGHTHPIITREIAEDIGFGVTITRPFSANVYTLTSNPLEQQVSARKTRSARKTQELSPFTELDLSLSSQPLEICDSITASDEQCSEIACIDLSWSYIVDVERFVGSLRRFPKLKSIVVAGCESWAELLINTIKTENRLTILKRMDCKDPYELPTIPVKWAQLMGIYDAIPTVNIWEPTIQKAPGLYTTFHHPDSSNPPDSEKSTDESSKALG